MIAEFPEAPAATSQLLVRQARPSANSSSITRLIPLVSATGSTAWAATSGRGRRALRPLAARARRQQRHDRRPHGDRRSGACARSSSPRPAPPASAARSLRRLFVHAQPIEALRSRCSTSYASLPVGSPLASDTLVGPLIDARCLRGTCRRRWRPRARPGPRCVGGERVVVPGSDGGYYVRPALVELERPIELDARRDLRADPVRASAIDTIEEAIARQQRRARRACPRHLHQQTCRRRSCSSRPTAATAASPTSTSVRAAPRSAALSAARRRPAAAASRARMPGRSTCAARRRRSTTPSTLPLAQGVKFDVE